MELRHLRYFYEVASEMNFTRAAEKLRIAQPPLSRQIRDLEEELGADLFVRRPHFLALTAEGEVFKQYAAQILALADKAAETVREMSSGLLKGTIDIATVEGHSLRAISEWISQFGSEHPSVQYSLWAGSSDEILARVRSGISDLAILQDIRDTEGLAFHRLFQESWTALIPKDSPLAELPGDTLSARDLLPYDLVIPARHNRIEEINGWFKDSEEKPKIRCKYYNLLTAYELARQSIGIAICPGETEEIVGSGRGKGVKPKRIMNPAVKSTFFLLYSKERIQPKVVSEFISFIRRQSR